MKGDPWQVLGVSQGASPQEIKRAYRRKALKEHPDVNKAPDAKERWQELSQAYDILSDPEKMRLWRLEQERAAGRRRPGGGGGGGFPWGSTPKGPRQAAMDAEYDAGGDSFGAIFGDLIEGLGKEVSAEGSGLGKARKVGAYVLEELLDFLGGARGEDLSRPVEELAAAREELATLQKLDSSLREESDTWAKEAEQAKREGRTSDELESMQKVFDARERRKNVRRTALRAEERVEYLEKVVFEYEKKQKAKAQAGATKARTDGPGMYTVEHDRTQVTPTEDLSSNWIAELRKGATVKVVEVIRKVKEKRVRGRLESPAGWISLLNTETGYRWASRVVEPEPEPWPRRPPQPEFDANEALAELKRKRSR